MKYYDENVLKYIEPAIILSPSFDEWFMIVKDILLNDEFQKRKYFMHHHNLTVWEHSILVSFKAFKMAKGIKKHEVDYGIAICGTGIGMSIACNKVKGVRCAKVDSKNDAYYARCHNNANVIALRSDLEMSLMKEIIKTFLETEFSNEERHSKRVEMIDKYV